MRAIPHRSEARDSVDFRSRVMTVSTGSRIVRGASLELYLASVHRVLPRTRALHALLGIAALLSLGERACAQTVLGYGEDATAAPAGAIRLRLSNAWRRSSALGTGNDTTYDSDRQYRASTIGIEVGVLKRFSVGVSIPWVTTKALTSVSSQHTVDSAQHLVLDTLLDSSHNGWGNIEALAKVVWLGEPGQEARLEPRDGVHVRSALVGGALLGSGAVVDPRDPFAIGTSDRARVAIVESATDLTVGRHFFGSFVGRYEKPMSDNVVVAVHPGDNPFASDGVAFSAARKLGARYEIEATPRYQFGEYFAAGVQYRYRHGAQDHYTGTITTTVDGEPVTLDASTLDAGTGITEHRLGFGAVYSAVEAYTRHRSRAPIEVAFEYSKVVSISNNLPKESQVTFSVRLFHRLWGAEFAPPAVTTPQPTLEPSTTPAPTTP